MSTPTTTHTIQTPDGFLVTCRTPDEANAFVDGFCAALNYYGIYKDGQQVIGCMETPIREIKARMKAQLGALHKCRDCGEPIDANRGGQCYGCGQQERREDAANYEAESREVKEDV